MPGAPAEPAPGDVRRVFIPPGCSIERIRAGGTSCLTYIPGRECGVGRAAMVLHGEAATFVHAVPWGAIGGAAIALWGSLVTRGKTGKLPWKAVDPATGQSYGLAGYSFWFAVRVGLAVVAAGVVAMIPGAPTDVIAGLGFAAFFGQYLQSGGGDAGAG